MDKMKRSQLMFVLQSDFEYLISILVASTYLATLTGVLGLSDGVTGVLSAIISLGSLFQIFTVFISVNRVKPLVIFMGIINQVFDYVPLQKRENSLAVTQAFSGLSGFLITVAVSPFLTYLQKAKTSGSYFLGINAYTQQILSAFSCIILAILIAYVSFYIIPKLKKQN